MKKKYNLAVVLGRFSPLHNCHLELIQTALSTADKVLIFLGSANQPRSFKNPFSFTERSNMIYYALSVVDRKRVYFVPLEDNTYNDSAWVSSIQQETFKVCQDDIKIALVGHIKDDSSYYIKMFPQWDFVDAGYHESLHATEIREIYFKDDTNMNYLVGVIPNSVMVFLAEFKESAEFLEIVKERKFIEKYRQQYSHLPYAPVFVTTDCCLVQSGHILLIKRKSYPGKGLLSLPGGFLDANGDKSVEDGMIRELTEETGIKLPEKVLRGNIKKVKVFDAINRSARGRTITHCFLITLSDGEWNLPKLRAGDDAAECFWAPIGTLKRENFFEDHMDIINHMLGT